MKSKAPGFLAGILSTALIGSIGVTALAATGQLTITVDPINVQVNGQVFAPKDVNGQDVPVFSYNGTTYAPLRALAEAYGLEVGYDAGTNMATVGSSKTASTITEVIENPDTCNELYFFTIGNTFDGVDVSSANQRIEDGLISVGAMSYISVQALLLIPEQSQAYLHIQELISGGSNKVLYNGEEYVSYQSVYENARSELSLFFDGKSVHVFSVIF